MNVETLLKCYQDMRGEDEFRRCMCVRIALLDDEMKCNSHLSDLLVRYLFESDIADYKIVEYVSGIDFLGELKKGSFDMIFLDVVMPIMDGFQVAHEIRRIDPRVNLVFVTTMVDGTQMGYEYNAKAYLYKEVSRSDISKLMNRLLREKSQNASGVGSDNYIIREKYSGGNRFLKLSEVLYFENSANDIIAITATESYVFRKKISELEEELSTRGFLRVHQGFLVNISQIFQDFGRYIVLRTGQTIDVSRRYKKSVQEVLGGQ